MLPGGANEDMNNRLASLAVNHMTPVAREHRAIAEELLNKRMESLSGKAEKEQGAEEDVAFSDQSFVEVTPQKKEVKKEVKKEAKD